MAFAHGQVTHEANYGCEEKKRWLTKANQVVIYATYCSASLFHN